MNFFVADGVRLAYRIDGPDHAPTIVMLNSLGTDLRMWDPQVALLSHTLRIVRYDCRGHGSSDVPAGPYTLERLGLDLLALFDRLGIEQAYICGLSLGGMVALWFAASYPDRVVRAVFANTAARIGTQESWNARIEAVRTGGMRAVRDMALARFLSEGFRRKHPEVVRNLGDENCTPPSAGVSLWYCARPRTCRMWSSPRSSAELSSPFLFACEASYEGVDIVQRKRSPW